MIQAHIKQNSNFGLKQELTPRLHQVSGIGYVLTDRASWIAFGNKGDYQVMVEGDTRLFNQYGVTLVNPDRHPNVKTLHGQQFIDWLLAESGQQAIAEFKIDEEQLFFPNSNTTE